MRNKIIRILPVITTIAVMVMIFLFSAQNSRESSSVSKGFIMRILNMLPFTADLADAKKAALVKQIHNIVRKCAHFSIYAVLGASACAMFVMNLRNGKKIRVLVFPAAFCCAYAATDEFHQTFIDGRSGEIKDILIDTGGGVTGAVIMLFVIIAVSLIVSNRRKKYG